jgi:hypothetical protein
MKCKLCKKDNSFITTTETFKNPEGGYATLKWCSNVQCDYNERVEVISAEGKKFIEENMSE